MQHTYVLTATTVSSRSTLLVSQFYLIRKLGIQLDLRFLFQGILGNGLESLLNIQCLFRTCFKVRNVVFALTPLLSPLTWNLDKNVKCKCIRIQSIKSTSWKIISNKCTSRFSMSHLLPRTTNGKFSGSLGEAWMRNSSLQLSKDLNVFGAATSKTNTQQSAPR